MILPCVFPCLLPLLQSMYNGPCFVSGWEGWASWHPGHRINQHMNTVEECTVVAVPWLVLIGSSGVRHWLKLVKNPQGSLRTCFLGVRHQARQWGSGPASSYWPFSAPLEANTTVQLYRLTCGVRVSWTTREFLTTWGREHHIGRTWLSVANRFRMTLFLLSNASTHWDLGHMCYNTPV